jgi:hypothetical protein
MNVQTFKEINLEDPFFDSLKADYPGFDIWFNKKGGEGAKAYVSCNDSNEMDGFLYLKKEEGEVDDVDPHLSPAFRLKVGTFKINPHGTKLGERFLKKVFDQAIALNVDEIYVTVFPKHDVLIKLFERYGFVRVGIKPSEGDENELVLARSMRQTVGDVMKDYPFIHTKDRRKYLLAIYPEWHTQLLPDSILNNESYDVVRDLSHTNSIHKVYVCKMGVEILRPGDVLVMYRTKAKDDPGKAWYRSVATSICVVEEAKRASMFATEAEFIKYCGPHSVFSVEELKGFYADKHITRVIKFTYNAAMTRRLIRQKLIQDVGLPEDRQWNFFEISDEQFIKIVAEGGVSANLIVD